MIPNRPYRPWWESMPAYAKEAPEHRVRIKGAEHVEGTGTAGPPGIGLMSAMGLATTTSRKDAGDPRVSPSGDIARRGTIPQYVPLAVMNPGRRRPLPQ